MERIIEETTNENIIMMDKLCKRILKHAEVLGRIVKCFIKEADDLSLEEIIELIKGKKDQEGNDYFQYLSNVVDIPHYGTIKFDCLCCINLPQKDGTTKTVYFDVEIQNDEYPGYALITRGQDYLSRMLIGQNGKEYDYRDYDGMKKVYVIWILPQAAKKRDGHINRYGTVEQVISGATIERKENYDKSEQIMIYLNKEHKVNETYEKMDELLTPLVVFFNNTLNVLEKNKVMKDYGFKEMEKEVTKMCNLGEVIARENMEKGVKKGLEKGQKLERRKNNIEHVRNLMNELQCSFQRAMDLLKLNEDERKEIEKYFQA